MKSKDNFRYIYFHPLFDERKSAQRFSFQLRNAFENIGMMLERPDYYGTGEQEGDFCEVDLDSLRKDTEQFCSFGNCVLIGLRFGAALILDYLKSKPANISGAILIEPVYDFNEYLDYLQRKQRIKDIMTGSRQVDQKEGLYVNIEGYKTQKKFLKQLEDYARVNFQNDLQIPVSVIYNKDCSKVDIGAKINILNFEPFWERIPPQNHSQLIDTIIKEVNVL